MLQKNRIKYLILSWFFVSKIWEHQNRAKSKELNWVTSGDDMMFFAYQNEREALYFDFSPSKMLWKWAVSSATFWWKWKPHLLMKHHSSDRSSVCLQVMGLILIPVSPHQKSVESTGATLDLHKAASAQRYLTEASWARKGLCSLLIYSQWIIQPLLVIALLHVFLSYTAFDFTTKTSKLEMERE